MRADEQIFPLIDYSTHPAFREFASNNGPDSVVQNILLRIDQALAACESSADCRGLERIEHYFTSEIDPAFAELARHCASKFTTADAEHTRIVEESLTMARRLLLDEVLLRDGGRDYRHGGFANASAERIARDMRENGAAETHLAADDVAYLLDATKHEREKLAEIGEKAPVGRAIVGCFLRSRCGNKVAELLERAGVIDGASHYLRHSLETSYVAVELSHDRQRWWRDCYEDVGLPTSPAAYMHNDESLDVPKVIIYLAPVGQEQGPFSFVTGSHRWQRSATQMAIFKAFDSTWATHLAGDPGSSTLYYRRRFKFPRHRQRFMAMPREFQGSSHFGDDLVAGEPLTDRLLAGETRHVGDAGKVIVFDGGLGIHRGGNVDQGQRVALNIGLRRRPSFLRRAKRELWYASLPVLSAGKRTLQRGLQLVGGGRHGRG